MLVLGANLTLDRTLRIARLTPGSVQRPRSAEVTAGGKAVNVCRAARAHGVTPRLVANVPEVLGDRLTALLAAEAIDVVAVPTAGELRAATVILEDDGRATVLNEPGPRVDDAAQEGLLAALEAQLPAHRVLVLTGSLPPGGDRLYRRAVQLAHRHGAVVVVDAARTALADVLAVGPDVVTPNLDEARAALDPARSAVEDVDPAGDVVAEALQVAQRLRDAGAGTAVVTIARHGAAAAGPHGAFLTVPPAVEVVNPIGAGDALVAGLAAGLEARLPLPEAVALAVATGTASVTSALAGHVDPAALAVIRDRVVAGSPPAGSPPAGSLPAGARP